MGMMVLASAAPLGRHDSSLSPSLAEQQHGVVPLLAAAPARLVADSGDGARGKTFGGVHLWHPPQPSPDRNPNLLFPQANRNPSPNFTHSGLPTGVNVCGILADYGTEAAAEGGGPSCHRCGDSRGYEFSTHVKKNTWVPTAGRREPFLAASSQKKPRLAASLPENYASHAPEHNAAPSWSSDTTASITHQVVRNGLPRQVRAPATFRCVRVTPVDSGEMEYAYHATVKIGGRVFKGILYSKGVDGGGKSAVRDMSDLHLGNQNGGASSSGLLGGTNCGS
ncbi:protein LATERAL ROOT PRIMORDIUM 1-like isoform X2 [Curcuma longa]|uniref:protein LATERAL ROOT PRIMORDIUM 1-like isoform X2 n=1 Tax=Curcuma longa TaxID=136217 RepID=UPI003D9EA7CC